MGSIMRAPNFRLSTQATILVSLAFATACGATRPAGDDTTSPDAAPITTTQLTVMPATATLNVVDGAAQMQAFTVMATNSDGTMTDVTATATLSVDANFGSATGNTFTTTGTAAGITTITANVGDQSGTAQVTVHVQTHRLDTGAVANAVDLFGPAATIDTSPSRAPTIAYPAPEVVMPSNIGDFDVHWQSASSDDTFEIEISSTYAVLDVYEPASPNYMAFTPDEWTVVSSQAASVTINVRSASSTAPGTIAAAPTQSVTLSDQPIAGGLYYWAASSTDPNAPYGIYRHDVAAPQTAAEQFYTEVDAGNADPTNYPHGRCVACHSMSRDGTKMSIVYDGGPPSGDLIAASLMDVATRTVISPSPGYWDFASYTSTGTYVVTESNNVLTLRDGSTAAVVLDPVPTGGRASHPDFSADDSAMTFVQSVSGFPWEFTGGSIMSESFDITTQTFGTPRTIVASDGTVNNYYPTYSPDGQWILFNRASGGSSYNNNTAEVWVVPAAGGTPIELAIANDDPTEPGLTNSWARWAPFAQTVGGEPMYWITVSSTRNFGTRLVNTGRPQIWMAAFFPERAAAGAEPSTPAFRLPFQDITSSNHIAQWADQVIPIQ